MILKYTSEVLIQAPIDFVVEYFENPQYLGFYQEGFVGKDLISGEPGKELAVSNMHYKIGDRQMVIKETIIDNHLPDHFEALYEHRDMDNNFIAQFVAINETETKYTVTIEYFRARWGTPRLLLRFFPKKMKQMSDKWMYNFRDFVERKYQ
ncbi:MAG: SRPBCC family protein [Bacteroidota bacterium]